MCNTFQLDHVLLSPQQQIGIHQQSTWELSLIMRGEGKRTIGDTTEPFFVGDVVLVPPQLPHCWRFDDTNEMVENITVLIDPAFLHTLSEIQPAFKPLAETFEQQADAVCFDEDTKRNITTILTLMKHQSRAMQVALLIQVLVLMAESESRQVVGRMAKSEEDKRLKNIQIFLNCNYQRQVTIDEVAQFIGMNRSAVCTFFRQQTGSTIMSFLTGIRLREAKILLENTTLTIQEICYKCGFQDVPHFCRVFKNKQGMTAKNWRQNHKK